MVSKQWLRAAGFAALAAAAAVRGTKRSHRVVALDDYRDRVRTTPEFRENPDWLSAIDTLLTKVEF